MLTKNIIITWGRNNKLKRIDKRIFDNLKNLTTLNLTNNQLQYIEPSIFDNLEALDFLFLNENQLRPENVEEMRHYCREHRIFIQMYDQILPPSTGFYTKAALRRELEKFEQKLQPDQQADEEDDVAEEQSN